MVPRSYLFVPGDRPDRFARAYETAADVVIIDLEDAVAPSRKDEARSNVASWLSPEHPVYVRVNGAETSWFDDDMEAVARPGLRGIMLPKAEDSRHVDRVGTYLSEGDVIPLVETARGVWDVLAIASAPRVVRVAFGALDLQLDTGISGDGDELLYARSQLVLASRLAGVLPPLDGVTTALDDADRLRHDVERARRFGFGGKLCIHPQQVDAVNEGFSPSDVDIAWARHVLGERDGAGGASQVDGQMIDRPLLERARRILEHEQQ